MHVFTALIFIEQLLCPCCCSVPKSCLTLCNPMDCSTPGFPVLHYFVKFTQNHWCYLTISSSAASSFCFQSFQAPESFPMRQFFTLGSQSIGASASATVLPVNIQDWFPLGLTGLILQSKGLSRVFSNTIAQKHQFFTTQPFLLSDSHIHTWLLEKP